MRKEKSMLSKRWLHFVIPTATTTPLATEFRHSHPDNRGFTLMEIVVVLLVMGIITAFAIGRGSSEGVEMKVRSEVFKTHLRHAQLMAMNAGEHWGIATNEGGTQYWLFDYDGTNVTQRRLPGEDVVSIDLIDEGTVVSPGIYSFDERGIPYFAAAGGTPPGTALHLKTDEPKDQWVNVSKGGENTTFRITQYTGFIE
jgi:prepilin-type N-terminal cleavage/methylation domain-containing protein